MVDGRRHVQCTHDGRVDAGFVFIKIIFTKVKARQLKYNATRSHGNCIFRLLSVYQIIITGCITFN